MSTLSYITLPHVITWQGAELPQWCLSYEVAGPPLGTAPVVLVCHALTGNSHVAEESGWWGQLIGKGQAIDTSHYTVICFNIPGNAYDGVELTDPATFSLKDVATLFLRALDALGVKQLRAVIGASMGGSLAWQVAALRPSFAQMVIPIATDYRASDWLLAQTEVQQLLLKSSSTPLHDARVHAMLTYRTPLSLMERFKGEITEEGTPKVLDWLHFHGRRLEERFSLAAYRTMTFLTSNIGVAKNAQELAHIRSNIHLVSIDSDLLFPHAHTLRTHQELLALGLHSHHYTISSLHGHDAFLMEYQQLFHIIAPLFKQE